MVPPNHSPSHSTDEVSLSPNTRGVISLVLFIYLFGLWVVMSSSLGGSYSSQLHERLMGVLQLYTEPLNLNVRSLPYYLYHGDQLDYEHFFRVEVTSPSGETTVYQVPGDQLGTGPADPYRYSRLAKLLAAEATIGGDTVPAEIAQGIGKYFLQQAGGGRVSLECIRRTPQPLMLEMDGRRYAADARDVSYEEPVYRATVLVDSQGAFQVIKEMAAEHSAPVQ